MTRNLRRERERSLHSATPPANPLSPVAAPRAGFSRSQTERERGEGKWFAGVGGRRKERRRATQGCFLEEAASEDESLAGNYRDCFYGKNSVAEREIFFLLHVGKR